MTHTWLLEYWLCSGFAASPSKPHETLCPTPPPDKRVLHVNECHIHRELRNYTLIYHHGALMATVLVWQSSLLAHKLQQGNSGCMAAKSVYSNQFVLHR